jgi:hypothetical protein
MSGWTDFFNQQRNTSITLIVFVIISPVHPPTRKAGQAINKAIAVFDAFGGEFAVGADAAAITREMLQKADALAERLRNPQAAVYKGRSETPATPKE